MPNHVLAPTVRGDSSAGRKDGRGGGGRSTRMGDHRVVNRAVGGVGVEQQTAGTHGGRRRLNALKLRRGVRH
eukprot:365513-Chlamydomonas_euryale.AAC.1